MYMMCCYRLRSRSVMIHWMLLLLILLHEDAAVVDWQLVMPFSGSFFAVKVVAYKLYVHDVLL